MSPHKTTWILSVILSISNSLSCWTTLCGSNSGPEYCHQQCPDDAGGCLGIYSVNENSVISPTLFQCEVVKENECLESECLLQSVVGRTHICCCREDYCNRIAGIGNLTFSLPPSDECVSLQCSHHCVVRNGRPTCFCPAGHLLQEDGKTCSDVDECLMVNCSHNCKNTNGSFQCTCPMSLRLDSTGLNCISDGLVCFSSSKMDQQFCVDESPEHLKAECMATYIKQEDGTFITGVLGCFSVTPENQCSNPSSMCELQQLPQDRNYYSCCCTTNLCNINVMYPSINVTYTSTTMSLTETTQLPITTSSDTTDVQNQSLIGIIISIFTIFLVVIIVITVVCCIWWNKGKQQSSYSLETPDSNGEQPLIPTAPSEYSIGRNIGRGHFGVVALGVRDGKEYAIKIFSSKESFEKELSIYSIPNFSHSNILKFMDSLVLSDAYWLVTEYHARGSLLHLLTLKTCSLKEFCILAESASAGMTYLHSEERRNGQIIKPSIVHRDLKPNNILVKADSSCCISDFGLGIKFPLKDPNEGHGQVGTSRYMAPEVLDGAILFVHSSYKHIDNYALGIVIYEILSRTTTNEGEEVPPYRPPFAEYTSAQPTILEMKDLVYVRQIRPTIPDRFIRDSKFDRIVETIRDSWESDISARISADMVCERIKAFRMQEFGEKTTDSGVELEGTPTSTASPEDFKILPHPPSFNLETTV